MSGESLWESARYPSSDAWQADVRGATMRARSNQLREFAFEVMRTKKTEVTVEGRTMVVSNLDKILYPAVGFSKAQLIDYYIRIAPVLLPHLKNRPLTLKRYPEGVEGLFFYEKQCPEHRPGWLKTTKTPRTGKSEWIDYCVVESLSSLVWIANLANLELHTFLHCKTVQNSPTVIAFDLDPGPPADIVLCCRVALWLRELLEEFKLNAWAKTSGCKGLQVYVPLNTPVDYEQTSAFSRELAFQMAREHPLEIVPKMTKSLRAGKVFIDWSQNDAHKTTVCVYSLRAKERPMVSTPVSWDEVATALKRKRLLGFDSEEVLKRVDSYGDLFEPILSLKQKLPKLELPGP